MRNQAEEAEIAWLSKDLLVKLRDKTKKYRQWKQGWVVWEEITRRYSLDTLIRRDKERRAYSL